MEPCEELRNGRSKGLDWRHRRQLVSEHDFPVALHLFPEWLEPFNRSAGGCRTILRPTITSVTGRMGNGPSARSISSGSWCWSCGRSSPGGSRRCRTCGPWTGRVGVWNGRSGVSTSGSRRATMERRRRRSIGFSPSRRARAKSFKAPVAPVRAYDLARGASQV